MSIINADTEKIKSIILPFNTYKKKVDDCDFLAEERNRILYETYGKLPSYACWDSVSVGKENHIERLAWFLDFISKNDNNYFSPISKRIIGPSAKVND